LTFTTIYLMVPLLITSVGTVPVKFLAPYLSFPIFLSLFYNNSKWVLPQILLVGFALCFHFINEQNPKIMNVVNYENEKKCVESVLQLEDKIIVNYFNQDVLNADVLHVFNDPSKYIFLDLGGFIDYPSIDQRNKTFFKEDYISIQGRYNKIIEEDLPIYGTEFQMIFIQSYLKKINNISLEFTIDEVCVFKER
jgi:hypothetical protein